MRRSISIKNALMTAMVIAAMHVTTSCDSCSRPDGNSEGTEDANTTNGDTRGSESATDNEGSGSAASASGQAGSSDGGSADRGSAANQGSGAASGVNTAGVNQQEITDKIENSSSTPRDAQGRPINSGGTSGSGQGTGTGSTGNNSRVSKAEDQNN